MDQLCHHGHLHGVHFGCRLCLEREKQECGKLSAGRAEYALHRGRHVHDDGNVQFDIRCSDPQRNFFEGMDHVFAGNLHNDSDCHSLLSAVRAFLFQAGQLLF